MEKQHLVITISGGSSMALSRVAEEIQTLMSSHQFKKVEVECDCPENPVVKYGWDGLLMDESVLIKIQP